MNFNGLVRQYYLRSGSNVGDLQVNLVDKHDRDRQSHEIARALRPALDAVGRRHGASVKVVEVPPGPPVLSPLVAEVYGPDYARSRALALELEKRFAQHGRHRRRRHQRRRRRRARNAGAGPRARRRAGRAASGDRRCAAAGRVWPRCDLAARRRLEVPAYPCGCACPLATRPRIEHLLALRVRGGKGRLVPMSELVAVQRAPWDGAILPQGPAAGRLRDRRRSRPARQPAVRHVRSGRPAARGGDRRRRH